MRILVTGATGFIGSRLTRFLLQKNAQVSVVMRAGSDPWRIKDILPQVRVIEGDLRQANRLAEQLKNTEFDVVVHLAWNGANSSKYKNMSSQVHENLNGSLEIVQLAKECNARKWIGFGSALEYGSRSGVFSESLQPSPESLYGISKYAVCLLAKKMCELNQVDFVWIRPFWLYGPFDDPLRMIPSVIGCLLRGKVPPLTLGEQSWDYLYIEDAVKAIWMLVEHPAATGIFNLGSGEVHTIRNIVERIRDLVDSSLSLGFGQVPYPEDQIMHLQADISKLKSVTGWKPQTSIDDGLGQTVAWHRRQMDG